MWQTRRITVMQFFSHPQWFNRGSWMGARWGLPYQGKPNGACLTEVFDVTLLGRVLRRYLMWAWWGMPHQGLVEPTSPRYLKWAWWGPPHQGLLDAASPEYLMWAWWVLSHRDIWFILDGICLTKALDVNLMDLRDFRLPPRSRWELSSSLLRSE
jgi:hypothetical protein